MLKLVKKSIYAGLGLATVGADMAKDLGRQVAKKAELSEKEGEKLAKQLQARSRKAAAEIKKTLDENVTKVAQAIHDSLQDDLAAKPSTKSAGAKSAKPAAKSSTAKAGTRKTKAGFKKPKVAKK